MSLILRTLRANEAARTLPERVLSHAQLEYNDEALSVTGEFGERFGFFRWRYGTPPPTPTPPGEKDGMLYLDDPALECGDACEGRHLLEAPCNYLEMASVAARLLQQ